MRSIVLKQKQRKYQAVKKREYIFLTQSAELQKDMLDMQQKVKRYKEHIYELESELQQRAELLASHEQKVTGVCHWCAIIEQDHRIVCFVLLTSLTGSLWFVYLRVFCLFVFCFMCGEPEQFDIFILPIYCVPNCFLSRLIFFFFFFSSIYPLFFHTWFRIVYANHLDLESESWLQKCTGIFMEWSFLFTTDWRTSKSTQRSDEAAWKRIPRRE